MAILEQSEIQQRLKAVSEWQLCGTNAIEREWKLTDFAAAIAFVERVAGVAEVANHHPDILVYGWNKVRLTLSTHSQGGLTEADFQLAEQVDRLA
jgi:4a-hydroxytetrahydrobiopterin dehydratase